MSDGKKGIGDNSKITEAKAFKGIVSEEYQSLNPVDPEFLNSIKTLCKDIYKYIQHANNEHRASHGDEYYFEHEIDEKNSCEVLKKVEFGVYRRPNSYEKKAFARDAEISLNHASRATYEMEQLIETKRKLKGEQ